MQRPQVSVLMSVFNGEAYLQDAVDSVLSQTGVGLELIVVNDASTDRSLEILRSCTDSRLRVIDLTENVGLVAALNKAAASAQGELLARLDADDLYRAGKLKAQVDAFKLDAELVLLGTAYELMAEDGKVFSRAPACRPRQVLLEGLQETGNQICHSSAMFKRSVFEQLGGYRALAGRSAQDYDLWLRMSEKGAVDCLPEFFVGYRCHGDMISIKKLPQQRRAAEIYKHLGMQRRQGKAENLAEAERQVDAAPSHLNDLLAGEYLRWADLFHSMGRPSMRRQMLITAIRRSPFGKTIRTRLANVLLWRLQGIWRRRRPT